MPIMEPESAGSEKPSAFSNPDRQRWMGTLSTAPSDRLKTLWEGLADTPDYRLVRAPEIGLVMTRGRMGGTGSPFNLTEMTVTRCSVRLADGTLGHGYVAGRARKKAELAAVCDAMLQLPEYAGSVQSRIIDPLVSERAARDEARARKVSATRVEFFTMVRGDNE